jgi:hypothetical protein
MSAYINNLGGRVQFGMGLSRAYEGELPPQHSIEDLFGEGLVISLDQPPRDRSMNEDIEEKGAHFGGSAKSWPGNDGVEPFFNSKEYLWNKRKK